MRKKLILPLLSTILFSLMGCNQDNKEVTPEKVDVVIISGQSNAVGCTKSEYIYLSIDMKSYATYQQGYPGIQIAFDSWTKDFNQEGQSYFYSQNKSLNDDFVPVKLGQGNSISTFGPEIGIAEALNEKYNNKLFLIKYACGASNLKDDWATRESPMYQRFIDYVKLQMNNLTQKGYLPTIKAFCWMQGEGDSYNGYYQHYLNNLRGFVGNVRTDLKDLAGNKEIPFIDAGISNASVWEYYLHVNSAKVAFAYESENNFYIDTIEAGLHTDQEPTFDPDICHYDSESEIKLGHLFAETFAQFLEPVEE